MPDGLHGGAEMSTEEPGEWRCVGCGRAYSDRTPGDLCPHDARVLVPTPTAERFGGDPMLGRTLADNYLIFDIVGLGGFGAVYRAVDVAVDGRHVAIKTIRPGAERHNADARARFTQEARLLEKLRDPNIVQVFHYGEADEALFMALELVPGRSLKRVLRAKKRLSPRRAVHITAQILSALEHAHDFGLVHRDLKPANILVVEQRDDTVKVIDFGIAKVLEVEDDDEGPKTGTGLVLGTVRYMAPEQLRQGGQIGPATDCYAVGIMFYEMLAGRAPFDGSQAEIAAAHLYQTAPQLDPSLAPPTLCAWVERVLLKDPEARYADAADMRRALLEALPGAAGGDVRGDSGVLDAIADDRPSGSMDGLSGPSAGAIRLLADPELPGDAPTEISDAHSDVQPGAHSDVRRAADGTTGPPDASSSSPPASTLPDGAVDAPATVEAQLVGLPAATAETAAVDPAAEDATALDSPTVESALVDGGVQLPEAITAESPTAGLDSDLVRLPDLAPERVGSSAWGDIDGGPTPAGLRETSGTIQAARGELGLIEESDDNRKVWWIAAAALIAAAAALIWLAPWGADGPPPDAGPVETIRLKVGSTPPTPPPPAPDPPPLDATVDAAVDAAVDPPAKADEPRPRKKAMHWRQVQRLENPILEAISACRCSQAKGLLGDLPRDFPRDRKRRLSRRIDRCKVPLVDQQCVDGEVR